MSTPKLLSLRIWNRIHKNPKNKLHDYNKLRKVRPQLVIYIPMMLTCYLLHLLGEPMALEMAVETKDRRKSLMGGRGLDRPLPRRHQAVAARTQA